MEWGKLKRIFRCGIACAAVAVMMLSCAGMLGSGEEGFGLGGMPQFSDPDYQRTPPPVAIPQLGENQVGNNDGVSSGTIDMSNLSKGYVAAACTASDKAVLRVQNSTTGGKYDYLLSVDGEYEFFPLSMGNGSYQFTLLLPYSGDQWVQFLVAYGEVQLENEFVPFLVSNNLVRYDASSSAVSLSYEISAHASSDLEVVQQVYYWIQHNIDYDTEKAEAVRGTTGYIPDLEQVLRDGKGICFDYAALVAAMLRANAIPCQMVFGDVKNGSGTVRHAWNLIWLEDVGMVAVKVPSTPEEWNRIDLTFAASTDPNVTDFIGDGSNYYPMSSH